MRPFYTWNPDEPGPEVIIYIHGYGDTAESSMDKYGLIEQFKKSGRKAHFLIPAAPSGSNEDVVFPDLQELLAGAELTGTDEITVIAHSGGYRTLRKWLGDPKIKHIIMLDAAYGDIQPFIDWGQKTGHTMAVVGYDTVDKSRQLAQATGSPYYGASGHMSIVSDGKFIPELLGRSKPKTNKLIWFVLVGTGISIGYLIVKRRVKRRKKS